ncbi:MAG TPA: hypothetical protein VKE93_05135 [Candidatus Angelobacter sp.]|nr:hypothetical protein [Candidatus Angelobacter sp.]
MEQAFRPAASATKLPALAAEVTRGGIHQNANRYRRLCFAMVGMMLVGLPMQHAQSQAQQSPLPAKDNSFTLSKASQLLDQITTGLVAHNQRKMLGAFDLATMPDGPLFQQQVTAFFAQTGNVRFHFNLLEASMDSGKGIAEVAVEMDAEVHEAITPPLRKQAKLRFVAENGSAGWKFTDVQPRAFFSTQP